MIEAGLFVRPVGDSIVGLVRMVRGRYANVTWLTGADSPLRDTCLVSSLEPASGLYV